MDELDATFLAAWTVPGQVRTLAEFRLSAWGLLRLKHDVHLIASELVANAVVAGVGAEVRVRFVREDGCVFLGVWDSGEGLPVVRPVVELGVDDVTPDACALDEGHDDGTGGWGLPIVEALSCECGVTPTPPRGKWVWARLKS